MDFHVCSVEEEHLRLWCPIQVGSYENPWEHQGLAHFIEHMLFLGSDTFNRASVEYPYVSSAKLTHPEGVGMYYVLMHVSASQVYGAWRGDRSIFKDSRPIKTYRRRS